MLLCTNNEVIQDITEFLYFEKESAYSNTIDLYNKWTDKHGIVLENKGLVNIAISFINDAKSLDKSMLAESYNIDIDSNVFSN